LNPHFMLFDEPLGALDPVIRSDLQDEFKMIFSKLKKTVLLVTHDLAEASFLGESISLMHDGRILQTGTLKELTHNPASPFVTKFINAYRVVE
jgi:osmoprotectant transport system ATP-binding protein